jgi:predicted double-glycine peptidase
MTVIKLLGSCALTLMLTSLVSSDARAGEVEVRAGSQYRVPVTSLEEARFRTVVRQKYDFSCGSAALATLLTYHYDLATPEQIAFDAMWKVGDQANIREVGFSMLDMKRYLESIGFRADGFRIPLDQLAQVGVPAITLINTHGYNHFVVLTGIERDRVLVADPALGLRAIRRSEFEDKWNGILFMIRDRVTVAQAHFNLEQQWQVHPKAPLGAALAPEALAEFTMNLRGRWEF